MRAEEIVDRKVIMLYRNKKWLLLSSSHFHVNLKSNTYEKNTVQSYSFTDDKQMFGSKGAII